MLIGLISDTHLPSEQRTPWDEVRTAFRDVELILHAGDITHPMVLDWLEEIAPVLAARGNNDVGWQDPRVKDLQLLDIEGLRLAMVHDMEPETRPIDELRRRHLGGEHADIMVTGDTHFERIDCRDGVLQINSGSATLPHHWSTRLGTVGCSRWTGTGWKRRSSVSATPRDGGTPASSTASRARPAWSASGSAWRSPAPAGGSR